MSDRAGRPDYQRHLGEVATGRGKPFPFRPRLRSAILTTLYSVDSCLLAVTQGCDHTRWGS
ncbi:MAG: hypothetical protein RH917_13100 [Lacipirellulaceae bacterium]